MKKQSQQLSRIWGRKVLSNTTQNSRFLISKIVALQSSSVKNGGKKSPKYMVSDTQREYLVLLEKESLSESEREIQALIPIKLSKERMSRKMGA